MTWTTTDCHSNTRLTAYNGTNIPQHGEQSLPCRYGTSEWKNIEFFIAETAGPVIFGLQISELLGIVMLNCAIQTQYYTDVQKTSN